MARSLTPPATAGHRRRLRLAITFLILAIPLAIWATMLLQWPQERDDAVAAYRQSASVAVQAANLRHRQEVDQRGVGFVVTGAVLAVSAVCLYQLTGMVVPPARPQEVRVAEL